MTTRSVASDLDAVPRANPAFAFHAIDKDTVVALSEAHRTVLSLPGLGRVVPWMNGERSVGAILRHLEGLLTARELRDILDALASRTYIKIEMPGTTTSPRPLEAVAVRATSQVGAQGLKRCVDMLELADVALSDEGALQLILTDDHRCPEFIALCTQAARAGTDVLVVKPTGLVPCLGPFIRLPDTACVHCLAYWVGTQKPIETWLEVTLGSGHVRAPVSRSAASELACHGLVGAMVQRHLVSTHAEADYALPAGLLSLDLRTLATQAHAVVKRPQCSHCGDPELMRRQAWQGPVLDSPAGHVLEGGYRRQSAQKTYDQYRHLVSTVTGPVCYLHPMPRRHGGMRQVFVSGYMVQPGALATDASVDKVCAGKGTTMEQARASALCEALERFSGVYQGDEARIRASRAQLGDAAVHFNALQQFSDRQFALRDEINARSNDVRRQVPLPFTDETQVEWTPAWSLTGERWRQVPLAYCYAQTPRPSGLDYGIHNPNGTAAGTSLAEALLQGTLELIERDATAIWWYNQIQRPGIDLASFGDPYFIQLVDDYARLGWKLWALDLTHDLGIPVCAAVAWHPQEDRHALGFGCHVEAHLALQRALTEVNQLFDPTRQGPDPWDRQLLRDNGFLNPLPGAAVHARDFKAHPPGLAQALQVCRQAFDKQGLEWLMVNKTRPDIGLNVVQAIAPGLRHFWPRFAPGRLNDVPVAMGWKTTATTETELNPTPLFL